MSQFESEGQQAAVEPGRADAQFKGRQQENPLLLSRRVSLLFYLGLRLIG